MLHRTNAEYVVMGNQSSLLIHQMPNWYDEHLPGLHAAMSPVCAVFLGVPCPVLTLAPGKASAASNS